MNDWVLWATKRPGPSQKKYQTRNQQQGLVCHSMEGWLAGSFAELDNPNRSASWHFSIALDGLLYQHYPLTASCWASGNYEANTRYVAVESEGVAGTSLNEAQRKTFARLAQELGFTARGANLFEHNEVATKWEPNAGPTSCPSHRYDQAFAELGEDDMADPRVDEILTTLEVTGVKEWEEVGNEKLRATIGKMQSQIAALQAQVGQAPAGGVPDHEHVDGQSGPVQR